MPKSNWHVLLLQALLQNSPNIEVLDVTNTFSLLNPMFFYANLPQTYTNNLVFMLSSEESFPLNTSYAGRTQMNLIMCFQTLNCHCTKHKY